MPSSVRLGVGSKQTMTRCPTCGCSRAKLRNPLRWLEVIRAAGLGLHRQPHVAEHKIHLRASGQPPIAQVEVQLPVGTASGGLVEHPVFEGFAVESGAGG